MTFDSALFDSIQLCLPIDHAIQTSAWQQSRGFVSADSQWNAYLNQLCLQTLLPWFQEELSSVQVSQPDLWELVNGSAVTGGGQRLVLIPTETIDLDEIRIPQEWVDIPSWAADYYLAVQVNPDEAWVRVAGFISRPQLQHQSQLDFQDRSYCLEGSDLIADLSVLWVTQQLAASNPVAHAAAPEPVSLTTAEAHHLIQRLGNPALLSPRLAVPLERWAALLNHPGWQKRLVEQRRGLPERRPLQWLQSSLANLGDLGKWSRIDYQLNAAARSSEAATPTTALARQVTLADQIYELQIVPVDLSANIWRFELNSLGQPIPAGVTLRLLSEDLQPFVGNEDRADAPVTQLFVEVSLAAGEGLVWQLDPTPAAYELEILRF
jgi:hypothetical protein